MSLPDGRCRELDPDIHTFGQTVEVKRDRIFEIYESNGEADNRRLVAQMQNDAN